MTLLTFQTREDMESFREMYERCQTEREDKLSQLKVWPWDFEILRPLVEQSHLLQGKVKNCYKAEKEKHRETKMAYVDIAPKAPRSIQKAQVPIEQQKLKESWENNGQPCKYLTGL